MVTSEILRTILNQNLHFDEENEVKQGVRNLMFFV